MSSEIKDIAWAAGFLEGEGYISMQHKNKSPVLTAAQVNQEPLLKLKEMFGGKLRFYKRENPSKGKDYYVWVICGTNAAMVLMTIYVLLSERLKIRAKEVIETWKKTKAVWGSKHGNYCLKGHLWTPESTYIRPSHINKIPIHRECKMCRNENQKKYQQERGRLKLAQK